MGRRHAVLLAIFGCLTVLPAVAAEPVAAAAPLAAVAAPSAPDPLVPAPAPARQEPLPPIAGVEPLKVAPPAEAGAPEELNLGWTLMRTMLVLGIVIMAIYLTLNFGLRRLMGIAAMPRGQAVVQVVERIPLDQKRSMFVVKAAGEYLLIGGGEGALQLIAKLDSAEVEKLQQQRGAPALAVSPFLLKLLKRRDVPLPPAPGDHS